MLMSQRSSAALGAASGKAGAASLYGGAAAGSFGAAGSPSAVVPSPSSRGGNSVIVGVRVRPENEAELKAQQSVAFTAVVCCIVLPTGIMLMSIHMWVRIIYFARYIVGATARNSGAGRGWACHEELGVRLRLRSQRIEPRDI
jgi:hypothetical protein